MDTSQAIIVKKIKKGGHGHHGGAWKVAFADFVTAMMAFFLLMWLMGSTTPEERAAISDFFQNPSAIQGPGGASTSMIKLGAIDDDVVVQKKEGDSSDTKTEKSEGAGKALEISEKEIEKQIEVQKDAQRLDDLKSELEKAIDASEAMKPFKDQLLLDITSEGLRIQIIDKKNRPMFASGSAQLQSYTQTILVEMSKLINKVPNKISLTGHTDATPYTSMRGYSNWDLSSDRANSSRRALEMGGLSKKKVAKVVGLSSTVLFDKNKPRSPVNRRISLIVMNKAAEAALQNDGGVAKVTSAMGIADALKDNTLKKKSAPKTLGLPPINKKSQTSIVLPKPALIQKPVQTRLNKRVPRTLGQPIVLGKPKSKSSSKPVKKTSNEKPSAQNVTGKPETLDKDAASGQEKQKRSVNDRMIRPIKPITPFKIP